MDSNVRSQYFPKFKEGLPNVEEKVFVITGTTSGTGFVAAQTVLEKGGELVCLNRKSQRVTDSTAKLQQAVPSGKIVNIECDLQDFESVKKAAEEIRSRAVSPYGSRSSSDGKARCVFMSSGARATCEKKYLEKRYFEKNGGNLGDEGKSMLFATIVGGGNSFRYSQSKLANSVMMYAMHEKLQAKGSKVKVFCAHPGGSTTSLGDTIELPWLEWMLMKYVLMPMFQSAEDGTMGELIGMMAEDAQSGVLYGPLGKRGLAGPAVLNLPQPWENDPKSMEML